MMTTTAKSTAPAGCHPHFLGSAIYFYRAYASITHSNRFKSTFRIPNFLLISIYPWVNKPQVRQRGKGYCLTSQESSSSNFSGLPSPHQRRQRTVLSTAYGCKSWKKLRTSTKQMHQISAIITEHARYSGST